MIDIVVPRVNTNDAGCILLEWLFDAGHRVPAGAAVALIETSKATQDLVSEEGGILHQVVEAGRECEFGEVIGHLFASEEERRQFLETRGRPPAAVPASAQPVVTRSAQELIDAHGVETGRLLSLGRGVIRRSDVAALIGATSPPAPDGRVSQTKLQRAVASVVTRSHRTIPTAFAAIKVGADPAHELLEGTADGSRIVGLPVLVVKAVGALHERFPLFFGTLRDDFSVEVPPVASVGVTVDVGSGLYLPVVRDPAARSVQDIADILMDFRIKALRDSFKEEDLAGGNIVVSLATESDVIAAWPIVFPSQTCMVTLCATQEELHLDASGAVAKRSYFSLGLAYDHRVVNGREAVLFLTELKAMFEDADRLRRLVG